MWFSSVHFICFPIAHAFLFSLSTFMYIWWSHCNVCNHSSLSRHTACGVDKQNSTTFSSLRYLYRDQPTPPSQATSPYRSVAYPPRIPLGACALSSAGWQNRPLDASNNVVYTAPTLLTDSDVVELMFGSTVCREVETGNAGESEERVEKLQQCVKSFWPTLARYGFLNFWSTDIYGKPVGLREANLPENSKIIS